MTELKRFASENGMAWRLMSLLGVGPMVATAIVGYIGEPGRFKRAKQAVRYAGLDAPVHQSGEERWQGRISKNGPAFCANSWCRQLTRLSGVTKTPWRSFADVRPRILGTGERSSPWHENH